MKKAVFRIFVIFCAALFMINNSVLADISEPETQGVTVLAESSKGENIVKAAVSSSLGVSGEQPSISMDFQDTPLKQILKVFSQQAGLNFVASEAIQEKRVTLYLDKVSVEAALNTVLNANGFTFEQQPWANIFVVKEIPKELQAPVIPTETRIYRLSYATVSGATIGDEKSDVAIENILKEMLSEYGKIIVDPRTNSILVTDTQDALSKVESVLKELDVKTLQVMISAEILEVSVDTLKRLGIEWGSDTGQFMTYGAGSRSTFWPFKESFFKGATETATIGSVSFSSFTAVLKAIKSDSTTQYLARPRLLTLNNKTAEMKITKNAAVSTSTVTTAGEGLTQSTAALERYEVGTMLKVTPHINKDDYITMTVEPEVSRVKVSSWNANYYDPFTRSAKTTIMVKDGETIIIAGLIAREDSDANRRVPIFGEVPIFGKLFSRDENQKSDTEVLIFLTPRIIKEEGSAFVSTMQDELGISSSGFELEGKGSPITRKIDRDLKGAAKFQRLVREQDSPLSEREVIMDSEIIKLKSAPIVNKVK